jgi:TonB-linked SusC/RagA family outer membrane protein
MRIGFIFFMLLVSMESYSQKNVTGVVYDETGETVIGANILVKGTSIGTVSDYDGNFEISVPEEARVLEVSYIGYSTVEVSILEVSEVIVTLESSIDLSEIVVTALGIKRDEKALGYAVQTLGSDQISTVKPTNIANALAGKVSGVYVTGSSAGPTASANINIRGAASLLGNNQPLFVVNGMPITNDLYSFDDGLNGSSTIDFGNAAQVVNPDDIASINILKGPAASALYGSRAADGVILIETKTGENAEGWGVEFNNTTMFSDILKMPDYQNEYGFGGGGKYSYLNGSNYIGANEYYEAYGENWGSRLDAGNNVVQFNSDGEAVPYTSAEDNIRDFYRTGSTIINNLSLSNSSADSDLRLSFTRIDKKGMLPNTDLTRNSFQTSIGKRLFDDKLSVRVNAMYVNSSSGNVPSAGYDESSSVQYGWLWYPRQVHVDELRDYWQPGLEGEEQRYVENLWVNNPWLVVNENTNAFTSNRLIANLKVDYSFTDRLSLRVRYGADVLDEGRQYRRAPSTKGVLLGSYREDEIGFTETNTEALLSYSSDRLNGNNFQYDVRVGGNIMRQNASQLIANNPQLKLFGTEESVYTLTNNRAGVLIESQKTQSGINSLFGLATVSYKNFLYLDASVRNDWSSTLVNPLVGKDNSDYSFLYPSVSLSAIVSEMVDLPATSPISFLKLRASYAEVGNGAPPYAFGTTYTPTAAFGGNSTFTTNRTVADPDLTNERTAAYELGVDFRLWKNRLRVDATYYNMLSDNQIILLPAPSTSGYDFKLTNGGAIRNQGVEVLISATPIQRKKFSWTTTLNLGRNIGIVESLPDVIESGQYSIIASMFPNDGGTAGLEFVAQEGELFGQLVGLGFERTADGQIIHENGVPLTSEEKVSAGSYQPDLRLGLMNEFSIGNFNVGILVDGQIGGKIYSRSHALYATGGAITHDDDPNLDINTLDGRTTYSVSYDVDGRPVYTLDQVGTGVIAPGAMYDYQRDDIGNTIFGESGPLRTGTTVDNDGIRWEQDADGNWTGAPVQPGGVGYVGYFYQYYGNGFRRDNIEASTYDATYFKLRELSIGYNLPKSLTERMGLSTARVSLVGRNLLLFSDVPTIDPETYSTRNGQFIPGFESQQIFPSREFGFSINLGF